MLAILGVALLLVAGGLIAVTLPTGSKASQAPGFSGVAPARTAESTAPLATATAVVTGSAALATRTAEPVPVGTWGTYAAPDAKWTVLFPGASPSPLKTTQEMGTGPFTGNGTMYAVYGQGQSGYAVLFVDFDPSAFGGMDPSSLLSMMAPAMGQSVGGTVVSSAPSKVGTYTAEDETISAGSLVYDLRMLFVGPRFYVLMVVSTPGDAIYPRYFMDSFNLK